MDKFLVKQHDLLLRHADSVVLYAQEQCIGTVFNGDIYNAMPDFAFQTMYDSVFYERLENELRHSRLKQIFIFHFKLVAETAALDGEIVFRIVQFIRKCDIFLYI